MALARRKLCEVGLAVVVQVSNNMVCVLAEFGCGSVCDAILSRLLRELEHLPQQELEEVTEFHVAVWHTPVGQLYDSSVLNTGYGTVL